MTRGQRRALTAGLVLLAIFSLGRAIHFTFFSSVGGVDFHSYWYAGHFVRQGHDPYHAYLQGEKPEPIMYLGSAETVPPPTNFAPLEDTPANTAPIVLLLTVFAWLPWQAAKSLWFAINLGLALWLPTLTQQLLPSKYRLHGHTLLLFYLIFWALKGTRTALGTGQTTLIVFTLMLLTVILAEKRPFSAGLLLGIALSKYSIALPLFLFMIYKRQWRVLFISLAVQAAAILAISGFSGSTPRSIVAAYFDIMRELSAAPGLYLGQLFADGSQWRTVMPILFTLLCAALLLTLVRNSQYGEKRARAQLFELSLLSGLLIWVLLVAYHRPYDGVLILPLLTLIFGTLSSGILSAAKSKRLFGLTGGLLTLLIVPYEQVRNFLPIDSAETVINTLHKGAIFSLIGLLIIAFAFIHTFTKAEYKTFTREI